MLTHGKRVALNEKLVRNMARRDHEKDHLCFVGSPFLDLDEVCEMAQAVGYHVVDCELFRHRKIGTDAFMKLIDWQNHNGFAFVIPRSIPLSFCFFLYNFADHRIVSTESGFSSEDHYQSSAGKAWIAIMTPEDWESADLESGWDRSKLTRVLSDYCWLHDNRYG